MAFNLFDVSLRVARGLNATYEGVATGGTTTTIIDTNGLGHITTDDYFTINGGVGTAWITYDAGAASAAPEGEWALSSSYTGSASQVTISTVTQAVAAGDGYAVTTEEFPRGLIVQEINTALMDMGPIPITNSTGITIADNQTEYTLPAGIAGGELRQVYLQRDDDDANDNMWKELFNWYVEQENIGTADTLILPYQYSSGYDLKIVYTAPHPQLNIYTDKLSEHVPLERVVYPAVLGCLRYKKQESGSDRYDDQILKWEVKSEKAMLTRNMKIPSKPGKRMIFRSAGTDTGDVDRVRL